MKRFNTVFFSVIITLVLLVVSYATVLAKDEVIILEPDADSTIFATTSALSSNFGGRVRMRAGVWRVDAHDRRTRTLIKFDLSNLPKNVEIVKAELRLTRNPLANAAKGDVKIAMYKLLKEWGEGTGDGTAALPGDVTWLHNSFPVEWAAPGADGPNVDRAAQPTSVRTITADTVQVWTGLEADVKAWYEEKEPNYGWVLASPTQDHAVVSFDTWYTKEADDEYVRPILVLTIRDKK